MMEFEIARGEFHDALRLTQGIVERRNTLPILSAVRIDLADDRLTLQATDGEIALRKTCEGKGSGSGQIAVNARKLYEITLHAPGDSVRVKSLDNQQVEVSSGKSRYRLVGMDPREFPSIPELSGKGSATIEVTRSVLDQMIERTLFAVSMDETRYNLSGVFATGHDGSLRMVATDGHRLALIDRKVKGKLPDKGVILPRKGLAEVRKLLDSSADDEAVTLSFDRALAKVSFRGVDLSMRLVEGEFPDYRQVIPKKGNVVVSVPCGALLNTVRRVSLLSTERSRGVRVSLREGALDVRANNPGVGEAADEIEVTHSGPEIAIGFNARYLVDVLGVFPEDETIDLAVTDDVSPGTFHGQGDEQYTYVVMPMRLETAS